MPKGKLSFKKKRHQGHGKTQGGVKGGKGSKFGINYAVMPGGGTRFGHTQGGIYRDGGKIDYEDGGKVQGPAHEEGGVPVVQDGGSNQQVAEIEGGERIFSVEDTKMIEQAASQILQLADQDQLQADNAARELGYQITEMVLKQEQSQNG